VSIPAYSFVIVSTDQRGVDDLGPRQESTTMTEPRVIHFEILGKDQKATQDFWSSVFGWKLNTDSPGGYGMTNPDQTGIVVGIGGTQDGSAGHVTGYVRVASVDATLARAVELGGKVIMPRFSPDGQAWLGLVADADGHVVGLSE
jgi:predicted enzyme related to lactoylglutathione lyase